VDGAQHRTCSPIPTILPRLAFGEDHATTDGDVDGLLAAQRVTHRSLVLYEPLGGDREFCHTSAVVTIGGLRLAASAHTPIRVVVDASDDVALMVPFAGWSTAGSRAARRCTSPACPGRVRPACDPRW
jgi:hypothetical protein